MKVTVDTTNKTITFLENITIAELKAEFENHEWDDFTIVATYPTVIYQNFTWYPAYPVYQQPYYIQPSYPLVYNTTAGNIKVTTTPKW